jgi:peptidoglycan/LPS O-acetylase OafA/YrhL
VRGHAMTVNTRTVGPLLSQRFLRLAAPLPVIILLSIIAYAIADKLTSSVVSAQPPELIQVAAHLLLVHKLFGFESLSAGLWYPAIDFQLFAIFLLLVWLANRLAWSVAGSVLVLTSLSALVFNRMPEFDALGLYFFGAYGLGILTRLSNGKLRWYIAAAMVISLAALFVDFRERFALALLISGLLWLALRHGAIMNCGDGRLVRWLSDISYSVFLVHFPILLMVNAAFTRIAADQPIVQAGGMVIGWLLSVIAGAIFYRFVDLPLQARLQRNFRSQLPTVATRSTIDK